MKCWREEKETPAMKLPGLRFTLWRLMVVVALVACAIGAGVAFSSDHNTATNVLTGWAALYGVPVLVIVARGVPAGKVVKIAGRIVVFGVPVAGLFGLLCFAMSGYVGLIGGFTLAALVIGWVAFLGVGLFCEVSGVGGSDCAAAGFSRLRKLGVARNEDGPE
jgi:hypothetical protein